MTAPHCPLASRGSACRALGLPHTGPRPGSPALRQWRIHSPQAAHRLALAVADALGCEPWPNLLTLCRSGAADALRWLRSQAPD